MTFNITPTIARLGIDLTCGTDSRSGSRSALCCRPPHQNRHLRREEYRIRGQSDKVRACDRFDISLSMSGSTLPVIDNWGLWQRNRRFTVLEMILTLRTAASFTVCRWRTSGGFHSVILPITRKRNNGSRSTVSSAREHARCYRCHLLAGICRGGCLAKILKDVRRR